MNNENKFAHTVEDVERHGAKIILPDEMKIQTAVELLLDLQALEEQEVSVVEEVDAFPLDGAHAFMQALKQTFGWARPVPTPGFFGDSPPTTVSIPVDANGSTLEIVWGTFSLPNIEGELATGTGRNENGDLIFVIQGMVKRKYRQTVSEIAQLTRRILKENSLYKGKAIVVNTNGKGELELNRPPTFLNTAEASKESLIFSKELEVQIKTNVFAPIWHTDLCRELGVPLKRGVLLAGPYGTGKTLTAYVAARECEVNGWTFIMLKDVRGLPTALRFAEKYSPALVFAEDIDRTTSGERTSQLDGVLNSIDGVANKSSEVMVVLTTNHADDINKAMLRPGRLDAVLFLTAPDAEAARRLVHLYAHDLIDAADPLVETGKALSGMIPAIIREVVERSKLYAVYMGEGKDVKLTDKILATAAYGMKPHLDLLFGSDEVYTPEHMVGEALIQAVKVGVLPSLQTINANIISHNDSVDRGDVTEL